MTKTKECLHCNGTGQVLDHSILGREMRQKRELKRITGREMARRLKVSAAYLSDLELGRRYWHGPMIKKFNAVLKDQA